MFGALWIVFQASTPLVHGVSIANSSLSWFNLSIQPNSGTVSFTALSSSASAFAEARNSLGELVQSFDMVPGGDATANAAVTDASGQGTADAVARTGSASSAVIIPLGGGQEGVGLGQGTFLANFMITGGAGMVDVGLSLDLVTAVSVSSDVSGILAEAEAVFALEIDGVPRLFRQDRVEAMGPLAVDAMGFAGNLSQTMSLEFDTEYFLLLQADAEARVVVVPEGAGVNLAGVVGLLALVGRWFRQRAAWKKAEG